MKEYKNISQFFEDKGPEDTSRFVDKNLDISDQVQLYLEEIGWSQKKLAKVLSKSEAEVSKWLSGTHNLTLRSIAKLEAALGKDIIITPYNAERIFKPMIQYVTFKVHARQNELVNETYQTPQPEKVSGVKKEFSKPHAA